MDRTQELGRRVREFEHAEDRRAALDLHLRLAEESDARSPAALWSRIGDLQRELDPDQVEASYTRAIELFIEADQRNNAIAVCFKLLSSGSRSIATQLRLGELAIAQGYRAFARAAIGEFARRTAELGRAEEALGAIDAYLDHFPDETDLWLDWVAEILGLGRKDDALRVLRHLWEHFTERGEVDAASRVRAQIVRLSPGDDPQPATPPTNRDTAMQEFGAPLLQPMQDDTPDDSGRASGDREIDVIPLVGLEPTQVETEWEPHESVRDPEPLPLLETSGSPRDSAPGRGEESDESTDDDDSDHETSGGMDPLPLLEENSSPHRLREGDSGPDDGRGDVLGDPGVESEPSAPAAASAPGRMRGVDRTAIVAELRRLAPRPVAAAEPNAHFDLGVAFKEMGLLDDSLARFAAAVDAGHPPGPVLEILGELLVGRGDHATALRILALGLDSAADPDVDSVGILYWLARSNQESGNPEEARRLLESVVSLDSGYRDASERLRTFGSTGF